MESKPHHRAVHVCRCPDCQRGRQSDIIEEHRAINQLIAILDEKWRRLFAGFWATVYGRGGIARLAVITGLSRTTIHRGQKEFLQPEGNATSRTRKPGGGRKRIEKKQRPDRWLETPGFAPYLQAVSLEPANLTRTCRAVRCLTTGLRIPISLSGNSTSSTARVRPVDE